MTSEVAYVPELVGFNYLSWKRNMIDVLKSKSLWRLVNGEHKTPTAADDLAIWEAKSDQARGLIGQTVAYSLQVSIEAKDNPVQVWQIISSLFDKSDDVSTYYLEKNIFDLEPTDFERVELYLAELKTLNEKLNIFGKDYKKMGIAVVIIVEQKVSSFGMFMETRNRALELSQTTTHPNFDDFCKGLINEQERFII